MGKSKRITVTLSANLYDKLNEMKRAYQFRSVSELAGASINVVVSLATSPRRAQSLEEEITEMFADLSSWDSFEFGNKPKQHRSHGKE